MMTDDKLAQCEAMMHLETALGLVELIPMQCVPSVHASIEDDSYEAESRLRREVAKRLWAALYLLQSMNGGNRPENFSRVLEEARWYDARNEATDVINEAKRSAHE